MAEARTLIIACLPDFSPLFADIAELFFTNEWI
jgi:hypothetical protein